MVKTGDCSLHYKDCYNSKYSPQIRKEKHHNVLLTRETGQAGILSQNSKRLELNEHGGTSLYSQHLTDTARKFGSSKPASATWQTQGQPRLHEILSQKKKTKNRVSEKAQ